jgi:hypothetical protein
MIATIVIVSLALVWLGYETRWMRVRLLTGAAYTPPQYEYKTWDELELWRLPERYQPFWLKHPDNMLPLCGWDYLKNTMHVIPDITMSLYFGNGYRQTFRLLKPELMKQIIKINANKRYFRGLAVNA